MEGKPEAVDPFRSLSRAETITIDQRESRMENCCKMFGCCCADFQNQYDILIPEEQGFVKYTADEESGCCCRMCCNPHHELTLHVKDPRGGKGEVLSIYKPFKCCICALCGPCQKEITIRRPLPKNEIIGYAQQPCCGGCLTPTINMYKEKGGKPIGNITGPLCCIGGCCSSEFDIHHPESGAEIAQIRRGGVTDLGIRRALLSNSDKYQLKFTDKNLETNDKLTMISSLLFIDYLFFEGETDCIFNCCVCPPQCWFKICDLYCCGCSLPLRVKCCIPEDHKK